MSHYLTSLVEAREVFARLDALEGVIEEAAEAVACCLNAGGKLLLCGNGGSAADSSHFSTEITCRFKDDRRPYPSIALAADAGLLTAIANDYSFEDVFSRQVQAYGRAGDLLIAFSTSGNSKNIIEAIEATKILGMGTIAFLGKGGGATQGLADIEIVIPATTTTARIQEAHKFLLHVLCEIVETKIEK